MRGRKPGAVELKIVRGNPGKRKLPDAPKAVAGEPDCPPHLAGEAREEWGRVVADLRAMGTLGRENRTAIAVYCQNWARMVEAEAHVAQHGPIVPAPRTGTPMHNPYLAVANKAAEIVMKLAAELCLTVSSRGRATKVTGGETKEDPAERFFA